MVDIRWAHGARGWLEIRDPRDGRIYTVWAADCPPWWRQSATIRAKAARHDAAEQRQQRQQRQRGTA